MEDLSNLTTAEKVQIFKQIRAQEEDDPDAHNLMDKYMENFSNLPTLEKVQFLKKLMVQDLKGEGEPESVYNRMIEFMEEHLDIREELDEKDIGLDLPFGDVSMKIVDKKDYYGSDCSGKQRLMELFFCGHSDYGPFIWIGDDEDYMEKLDQYPIYEIDFSCDDSESNEPIGNFKQYITKMLENYDKSSLVHLEQFSDNMIDKGNYCLKIPWKIAKGEKI